MIGTQKLPVYKKARSNLNCKFAIKLWWLASKSLDIETNKTRHFRNFIVTQKCILKTAINCKEEEKLIPVFLPFCGKRLIFRFLSIMFLRFSFNLFCLFLNALLFFRLLFLDAIVFLSLSRILFRPGLVLFCLFLPFPFLRLSRFVGFFRYISISIRGGRCFLF